MNGKPTGILSLEHTYSSVVRSLPVGFSLVDKEGIIVEFNPAAEEITGYSRTEVVGSSHLQILHNSLDLEACPFFSHVFQNHEESVESEGTLIRKDGRSIIITITSAPLFDGSGVFTGGAEIFRDLTETKRLERERRNILSMFVHDMKNPLLIARAVLTKALEGQEKIDEPKREGYLKIVLDETGRLERLVSEFLDFSNLEGRRVPNLSSFDATEVIRSQVEGLSVTAAEKEVSITFECPEQPVSPIHADRSRVERVIANLIENALKYNVRGGSVTVRLTETEKDLILEVSDTGIGIKKEDLPHIFDVFYRADRSGQGVGLGLAVARRIVEDHGGTIAVDSVFGGGTTFRVTFPKG
jgi:two-component system phosphate regulon sensor histidine kinase PhoR